MRNSTRSPATRPQSASAQSTRAVSSGCIVMPSACSTSSAGISGEARTTARRLLIRCSQHWDHTVHTGTEGTSLKSYVNTNHRNTISHRFELAALLPLRVSRRVRRVRRTGGGIERGRRDEEVFGFGPTALPAPSISCSSSSGGAGPVASAGTTTTGTACAGYAGGIEPSPSASFRSSGSRPTNALDGTYTLEYTLQSKICICGRLSNAIHDNCRSLDL